MIVTLENKNGTILRLGIWTLVDSLIFTGRLQVVKSDSTLVLKVDGVKVERPINLEDEDI